MKKLADLCAIVYITLLEYVLVTLGAIVLVLDTVGFETLAIVIHDIVAEVNNHVNDVIDSIVDDDEE